MNFYPDCCENFISGKGELLPLHATKAYGVVVRYSTMYSKIIALDAFEESAS